MYLDTSRRRFLIGSASVAAAAVPVAKAAATESPALLQANEKIVSALAGYRKASETCSAARAAYEASAPSIPQDLLSVWPNTTLDFHRIAKDECAVDGTTIYQPNTIQDGKEYATPTRKVLSADALREEAEYYSPRSKHGKEIRRRLAIAENYEAQRDQAKAATGVKYALEARYHAACDLERDVHEALKLEAVTEQGLLTKARGLQALREIGWVDRAGAQHCAFITHGQQLCSEILSVFGSPNG